MFIPGLIIEGNQIRTVDLEARGAKRIESVPEAVMDDVLARVQHFLNSREIKQRAYMLSPIDKIFAEIFGDLPSKSGTAFERLAAIATHIVSGGEVKHDDKVRGEFSKTLYQLDVHHKGDGLAVMGEAKDYSIRAGKVGRGDLQKLGGALPDLATIDAGSFYSATGFTKPAQKYAEQAQNIIGKPITLYGLRQSTDTDENGFIKTITIDFTVVIPRPEEGSWQPHITPAGRAALKASQPEGTEEIRYNIRLSHFYDQAGSVKLSLHELTSMAYGESFDDAGSAFGCFLLKDHYMSIDGVLVELLGLEFEIPRIHHYEPLVITDDRENRLVLLDGKGDVLRFFTDEMLRAYEFDDAGNLISLNTTGATHPHLV